jgi:DNA-directed RNA polymerase specialized sigma24 family protein
MSSDDSVSVWIAQLRRGDRTVVQRLWQRYYHRVVHLARKQLSGRAWPAADEEDAAQSALHSFFERAGKDQFAQLVDRNDLWQILAVVTRRKVINLKKKEGAQKRVGLLPAEGGSVAEQMFAGAPGREPDPEVLAHANEEYRRLLGRLGNQQLQDIALWKMEGYTNGEIATSIERSVPTVERKLALIRERWQSEVTP